MSSWKLYDIDIFTQIGIGNQIVLTDQYCKYVIRNNNLRMFNWLRQLVGGAKNRTIEGDYNLDLTYITPRIIAMAYPASGIEQIYRNCLEDVSKYINERHQDRYYVINVSNRSYDSDPFNGRVKEYEWNDHQAPLLTTMFQICDFVYQFLNKHPENVVAVHCNHGKGRTGTAIMAILMYLERYRSVQEVLSFYNRKRFSSEKYAVDQPCQIRYLQFFKEVLQCPDKYAVFRAYRLNRIWHEGLSDKYELSMTNVRLDRQVYRGGLELSELEASKSQSLVIGDVFIELFEKGVVASKRAARINFHLQFAKRQNGGYLAEFVGENLAVSKCHHREFKLFLEFKEFCGCHLKYNKECRCYVGREVEAVHWAQMHKAIGKRPAKKQVSSNFALQPETQEKIYI